MCPPLFVIRLLYIIAIAYAVVAQCVQNDQTRDMIMCVALIEFLSHVVYVAVVGTGAAATASASVTGRIVRPATPRRRSLLLNAVYFCYR